MQGSSRAERAMSSKVHKMMEYARAVAHMVWQSVMKESKHDEVAFQLAAADIWFEFFVTDIIFRR